MLVLVDAIGCHGAKIVLCVGIIPPTWSGCEELALKVPPVVEGLCLLCISRKFAGCISLDLLYEPSVQQEKLFCV